MIKGYLFLTVGIALIYLAGAGGMGMALTNYLSTLNSVIVSGLAAATGVVSVMYGIGKLSREEDMNG